MPQSRQRKRKNRSSSRKTRHQSGGLNKRNKIIVLVIILALLGAAAIYIFTSSRSNTPASTNSVPTPVADEEGMVTTASGLKYRDLVEGTGASPRPGQDVTVHYTGRLTNGLTFDTSLDTGQPFTFRLGMDPMIKGWDEGISSMKVGGKRKLIIPPALGYGAASRPKIPANSTLLFEIELLGVK